MLQKVNVLALVIHLTILMSAKAIKRFVIGRAKRLPDVVCIQAVKEKWLERPLTFNENVVVERVSESDMTIPEGNYSFDIGSYDLDIVSRLQHIPSSLLRFCYHHQAFVLWQC